MKHHAVRTAVITSAFAMACTLSALAGSWTHYDKNGDSWDSLWFYEKDNGEHAESEWITDNGTWYWIDDAGYVPVIAGISADGYLYNSQGIYVPLNDGAHHFVDQAMYSLIHEGITEEQVNAVLGQPHELSSSSSYNFGSERLDYATYIWYPQRAAGSVYVSYTNGVVSYTAAYWY